MDLARDVLLTTSRFRVERVARTLPDGTRHTREVVRHPGAVVILPLLDGDRVVLVRNYRVAVERELIELPAGTLEPSESPRKTALRELAEETGYLAKQIAPLTSFVMSPGILDERMHAFVARELTPGPQRLERGEEIAPLVMPLEAAVAAVFDGRIEDAKTICALLYFAAKRQGPR